MCKSKCKDDLLKLRIKYIILGEKLVLGLLLTVVIIAWVGYMLSQKYKPQGVLVVAGVALMVCAVVLGLGPILPTKQSTGFIWFDIFSTLKQIFSTTLADLGLTIMSVAGFVQYMEKCGASQALVEVATRPLKLLNSPLLIMSLAYLIGQAISIFIPSHAGLALLLMLTMYPLLIKSGISKLSALAIITTAKFTDIGAVSSNAILAAHTAGLDPVTYFINYQLPVYIPTLVAVGIAHYFVQPWWDKREGVMNRETDEVALVQREVAMKIDKDKPPLIYAVLPTLPLILVIAFSPLFHTGIKLDVVSAMLLCTIISMIFEFIRYRDGRFVLDNLITFFQGMGKQFTIVVSLIIAGQFFGAGLVKIGAVDTLIEAAQQGGIGLHAMVLAISAIMIISAFLMGSGNAAFFSFAAMAPKIAAYLHVDPVIILLPMELTAGFGRCLSPITAATVAIAGIAEVSPFQVAKRCVIPVVVGIIVNLAATFIIFL